MSLTGCQKNELDYVGVVKDYEYVSTKDDPKILAVEFESGLIAYIYDEVNIKIELNKEYALYDTIPGERVNYIIKEYKYE